MTPAPRAARRERAAKIVAYLKKAYPKPRSELAYATPFQLLAAVILSAQATDKQVNKVTEVLWKKYKNPQDFARATSAKLAQEISSIPFFRNKATHIITAAKIVQHDFGGCIPSSEKELVALPGVGYKTAHVILGELFGIWDGIATDTHVKRFAKRFDLSDENDLKKISKDLESLIPKKDWKFVNNGLVLYGRHLCPARPHDCAAHPLTKLWPKAALRWPRSK